MRVVIAGSSGLIGTALVSSLRTDNHDAKRLLKDQQALDSKLRSLRKSLFP